VKIGKGQQKIKIVRTNRQSNLSGSCQSIFSLCRHHPSNGVGWCQDNENRPNQESKFDFLATRQLRWCRHSIPFFFSIEEQCGKWRKLTNQSKDWAFAHEVGERTESSQLFGSLRKDLVELLQATPGTWPRRRAAAVIQALTGQGHG